MTLGQHTVSQATVVRREDKQMRVDIGDNIVEQLVEKCSWLITAARGDLSYVNRVGTTSL